MRLYFFIFLLLMPLNVLLSLEEGDCIFQDLLDADYWTRREESFLPIIHSHYMQAGYFNMPSARMDREGTVSLGYSSVPPYRNYNLGIQVFPILEISGAYRIFNDFDDIVLTPHGFGDRSDKGANFKINLIRPNDNNSYLPEISIGMIDFLGSRLFAADYVVATQCFKDYGLEFSLGYGTEHYNGLFGGLAWSPLWNEDNKYLKGLTFVAEYDNTDYAIDPHHLGRSQRSPVNYGVKYRLGDYIDLSYSRIRGLENSWSIACSYPWGEIEGFSSKHSDAMPYSAPTNHQALGVIRSKENLVQDLGYAFKNQGFNISKAWVYNDEDCKILKLMVTNLKYFREDSVRARVQNVLAALLPEEFDKVIVTMEIGGMPFQEYCFRKVDLYRYWDGDINYYELAELSPVREASVIDKSIARLIYCAPQDHFNIFLKPRVNTVFGSAKGKFKYSVGVSICFAGAIYDGLYYNVSLGRHFKSTLNDVGDRDSLNPSQIVNVRSDMINYNKTDDWMLDNAYLQKNFTFKNGFYARLAGGLFEMAYGGIASEILYYPVNSVWAIGVEGAELKKRNYDGKGFMENLRRLEGTTPTYQKFHCYQYFVNLYRDIPEFQCNLKVKAGRFLAGDYGARTEFGRYFSNGMRLFGWYTYTDAHDRINGETYYDKGIGFDMPLDIFLPYSSKRRWGTSISAWLRDVGAYSRTGSSLYNTISKERS